jgi:hypothetical protein
MAGLGCNRKLFLRILVAGGDTIVFGTYKSDGNWGKQLEFARPLGHLSAAMGRKKDKQGIKSIRIGLSVKVEKVDIK